jgi:hypothetical protein
MCPLAQSLHHSRVQCFRVLSWFWTCVPSRSLSIIRAPTKEDVERLCKALHSAKRDIGRACVWPLDVDIKGLGVFGDQVVHARSRYLELRARVFWCLPLDVDIKGLGVFGDQVVHARSRYLGLRARVFWCLPLDVDFKGAWGSLGVYNDLSTLRYFHFWKLT